MNTLPSDPFIAPRDDANPFLPAALDPAIVQVQLRRLRELQERVPGLVVRAARVLRHKPGRRCLIEYELARAGTPDVLVAVLGKVRARGADLSTHRLTRRLTECGFDNASADGVSVPEPLGAVPDLGMWLQARVPGTPATRLMGNRDDAALAVRIADALHKLHHAPVSPRRTHTVADELAIVRDRLGRVARDRPEWSGRLVRLAEGCERVAAGLESPDPAPLHRDFYPDQVMVDDDRVYLLDLDLCAWGDPALDVGNFVGHLVEQGLRERGDPGALDRPAAALADRFAERAGRTVTAGSVVYATLTLARHVWLSTLFPERRGTTAALLDLCERRLDLAANPRPARAGNAGRCAS